MKHTFIYTLLRFYWNLSLNSDVRAIVVLQVIGVCVVLLSVWLWYVHDPVHPVRCRICWSPYSKRMYMHTMLTLLLYRLNLRKYGNIMTSKNYSCSKHVIFVLNYDETEFLNEGNFWIFVGENSLLSLWKFLMMV